MSIESEPSPDHPERSGRVQQMRADAQLPADIEPSGQMPVRLDTALVTGATGFLGRYVLRALLEHTDLQLICLTRPAHAASSRDRVLKALAKVGVRMPDKLARVHVVSGDLTRVRLGLDADVYGDLVSRVDTVYHCAAEVNWARRYRQLRAANVLGTLELLRFASAARRKPLLFVSSIAVCFATGHTDTVDEAYDMLPSIAHMPLGYAQSKCVAESLVRQASQRGLPATIVRPALISGDSRTGEANTEDLIAALIEGCARAGVCGDSDWLLDCVPVDLVAEVIARVPVAGTAVNPMGQRLSENHLRTLHLVHDEPRRWQDIIACLNRFGCRVDLVSISDWLRVVFANRDTAGHRLYGYRRFFKGFGRGDASSSPFATYLTRHQRRIRSDSSYRLLRSMDIVIPPMNESLLGRYLTYYWRSGLLPGRAVSTSDELVARQPTVSTIE